MDDQLPGILARLGADAVRNSDGTWLPEITPQLGVKVYETYFPARGQQAFAEANLDARPRFYLMSERVSAPAEGPLSIDIMKGYYELQVEPDQGNVQRWWTAGLSRGREPTCPSPSLSLCPSTCTR